MVTRERDGWLLVENAPEKVRFRVLLLPGLLCTDAVYSDLLLDPLLEEAGLQLVAANPPGFKGQPVPEGFDYRIASYADLVESFVEEEPFALLVGHSFCADVLVEVAAAGRYPGKLMLISPSLYRRAEPSDTRTLEALSRRPLMSGLVWAATYAAMRTAFMPYFRPEQYSRLDEIVREARRTPRPVARRLLLSLFEYLDEYGDLTPRVCRTRVPLALVRGAEDNVGLSVAARTRLRECPRISLHEVPDSRHFVMLDRPRRLNELILEHLGIRAPRPQSGRRQCVGTLHVGAALG